MALQEPAKKGGPDTKKEKEDRRLQVHKLHFEENKSAVEISEILNKNRNTINEDIKFWHNQHANDFGLVDIKSKMKKQIHRMEVQRDRLFDYLEEANTIDEKTKLERFISDIDNKLGQFYSRAIFSGKENLDSEITSDEIEEDEIKDFIRYLILSYIDSELRKDYSDEKLKFEIIKKTKCNVLYAEKMIKKLHEVGLTLCQKPKSNYFPDNPPEYDIKKFASLRGYLSTKEYNIKKQERRISKKQEKQENKI